MNVEQARTLLVLLRRGLRPDATRAETDEALTLTGDLPKPSLRQTLKAELYRDSHAAETDFAGPVVRSPLPPFAISALQCAAVDEQAGVPNGENPDYPGKSDPSKNGFKSPNDPNPTDPLGFTNKSNGDPSTPRGGPLQSTLESEP